MPRNTAANRTSWLVEFGVLLSEDEPLEIGVLGFGGLELLFESKFVSGNLLLGEGKDSSSCLTELVVRGDFLLGKGLLRQITRVADFAGTKCALTLLEVRIRMLADFALIVLHHVDRLILCHS